MTKDLTQGSAIKVIIAFCIPLIFGNLFQQLYNMVDSIIVGQFISVDALAAVGSTGSINFLVLGFASGLTSGFAIPVAQAFGGKDYKKMRQYVINAIYLCVGATLVITAITMITTKPILMLMQTPANIIEDAYSYIIIIFAGIGATMLYNLCSAFLRSLGDSKTPLYFLIIASLLNVVLDLLFIINFHMGVAGAAYATVASQLVSGVLCLIFIKKKVSVLHIQKSERAFDQQLCRDLCAIGLPMALQFSITAIGSIVIQSAVNTLGSATVAAVTAANKIQIMVTQPLDTIGVTMATFCGQNLGAGKDDRIHLGIRQSLILSTVYSIIAFVVILFFGQVIALLFISSSETLILSQISQYLLYNSMFYFVLGILFVLRNALQGMGYSVVAMLAGAFEMVARVISAFYLVKILGYQAICITNPIAWAAAIILLVSVYFLVQKDLKQRCLENRQAKETSQALA